MIVANPHRFVLELFKTDGSSIGQFPLDCDLEPALEGARYTAQRRLQLPAVDPAAVAEVRPVWDTKRGQPYVGALDIALQVPGAGCVISRLRPVYFKAPARQAAALLVKKGTLQSGESFDYLVAAFRDLTPRPQPKPRFDFEEVSVPLRTKTSLLADFLANSVPAGPQDEQDIPVFISQRTLAEVDALTREAGAVEVASILIGHHHRDRATGDLFLEITAQIPAQHTLANSTKITFTPATWTAAQNLIRLRGNEEEMVGWSHNHPGLFWCNPQCPPEARARCPYQSIFFSADDCAVQRTVFVRASSLALLITNTDAGLRHAAFSWRNGLIEQRGFHIVQNPASPAPVIHASSAGTAAIGEPDYEEKC